MKSNLTFSTLRLANAARLPLFKNSKGELAHNTTGDDWSQLEWAGALNGETGEIVEAVGALLALVQRANKLGDSMKKIRRGDVDPYEAKALQNVAKELADVQIYLDLLAMQFGIDLGDATVRKFNEVSRRVKVEVFISVDDPFRNKPGCCPLCDDVDEGVTSRDPVLVFTQPSRAEPNPHYYVNDHKDFRPTDSGEFPRCPSNYAAERAAIAIALDPPCEDEGCPHYGAPHSHPA